MRISDWSSDVCSSDLSTTAGWHDARIGPREPLTIDTATAVLHYAQEIFEGLKAYRLADGGTALFRPDRNAARFRDSARRMAMAELPEELFLESIRRLVQTEKDWIKIGRAVVWGKSVSGRVELDGGRIIKKKT